MSQDAPPAEGTTPPAEGQTPPVDSKPNGEPRTYSQEDFDRVVGKVRSEERAKFAEFDAFKEKAERYDELAEQGKTAEQKLQDSLADRERELEDLRRTHQETLVGSAAALAAGKLGVVDPEAVTKLIDWSQIEYDESGRPKNVEDLVKALVAEKSYLTAKPSSSTFDGGARQPAPPTTDDPMAALGHGLFQHIQATRE